MNAAKISGIEARTFKAVLVCSFSIVHFGDQSIPLTMQIRRMTAKNAPSDLKM